MDRNGFDLRDWLLVILPIVGVIVGGVLTGGVELGLRRAAERKARRLGARVVFDEMTTAAGMLVAAREQRAVQVLPDTSRIAAVWHEHRAAFGSVPLSDWMQVQDAVSSLEIFAHLYPTDKSGVWIEDLDDLVPHLEQRVTAAVDALRRFAM